MFIVSVAVGRPFVTQEGFLPPELCPPDGYDSVVGEVSISPRPATLTNPLMLAGEGRMSIDVDVTATVSQS